MKRVGKIFLGAFILVIFALNLSLAQGNQDGTLYLDSTKFKPALDLIKDDPSFSITIWIVDGKEYLLIVTNKVTWEETNSIIMQSANADFEDYCLNVLGIDLHTMLWVKLSEKQKEWEKTYTVTFDANGGVWNMTAVSNIFWIYELPSNGFTAPSWKIFRWWSETIDWEVISWNNITISEDITLYAIWRNKCSEWYNDYNDELNICYYLDNSNWVPVYYWVDADASHIYNNKPISTITIFDPSSNENNLTMMDINLWATKTTRETKWDEQFGNYYQRWNNNWFKLSLLRRNSPSLYTTEKSKYTNYRPWHSYFGSKFVYWCEGLWYWERANKDGVKVAVKYDNLWWWWEDSPSNNRWWINNGETRQWPCPSWYHVPSIEEWSTLMLYWDKTKNPSNYKDYHTSVNMINDDKFMSVFKLSLGGYYDDQDGNNDKKLDQGFYWSSSPYNYDGSYVGYPYARFFILDPDDMAIRDQISMGDGLSVRCFKDSPKASEVFTIIFYENWGDLLWATWNDGEWTLIQKVESWKKIQKPINPTIWDDSHFKWWSTSRDINNIFDFNTIISWDVDLYAVWWDLEDSNINNCEKVSDYPLTDCPDWAMCSSVVCDNERKYKVDTCQPDYEMVDWECMCHRIYTNTATTDGTYNCACPYPDLCFMQVWLSSLCSQWRCDWQMYMSDGTKMNYIYFILDDKWAAAAGIENMDSIWDKRVFFDGAGEVVSVLDHYMSPANCEEIGQKYFSEKWKEFSVTYDEDKGCSQTCQCTDLNNCPEDMKKQCVKSCWNNKKEPWEDCSNCPQDFRNECVWKKIPLNPNRLTPDNLEPTSREVKEEKCDKNPDYSLTACPTGAICSYADCGDRYGYKIESCQNDYELKDGSCKCHKQLHIRGELAGRYSCSMCHSEWGGNMCTLDVKMESMCTEYENGSSCSKQNYTAGGARMYDIYFFLWFEAADALGIDADRLAQTKTLLTRGDRLHYGYRNGEDTEHDFYNHEFYLTEKDCKDIGERYFGSKSKGKEIDLPNGYSDNSCKQDCTGFDLNACPENKKCLVCGDKFKVVGEKHENKGWKCYNISDWEMQESDECDCDNYVNKSKDWTWITSEEPGCSVDTYMCQSETTGEKFYSGVCGWCNLGYEMKEPGKCEYIPCGADFWMEAQMNIACPEDARKYGITCNDEYTMPTKEFVPMNGCTQEGKQVCEKHYGSDAYVGNQKWLKGYGHGDERDGCTWGYAHTYFKCTECEADYTLKNGACVADSGIGSIYYYKDKPIGIVFEETQDTVKVVSLQNLGGLTFDYSYSPTPRGTSYYWEDAKDAAGKYAPEHCEMGSLCGKGKWRLPTLEEMQDISDNFDNGGPLVQAIRWLEASCSKENSMSLPTTRYWTSTSVVQHTNAESVYGGADINAAYVVYHPIYNRDYKETAWKKNSIAPYMRSARPVLTIRK